MTRIQTLIDAVGEMGFQDDSKMLTVCGQAVARLSNPGRCNGVLAEFVHNGAAIQTLSALAALHPTGLVALTGGGTGVVFRLLEGCVTACWDSRNPQGPAMWMEAFRRQRGPFEPDGIGDREALATYVRELVLDGLRVQTGANTSMLLIDGPVAWKGSELAEDNAPDLSVAVHEHARRVDELPKLLRRIGSFEHRVVRVSEPPAMLLPPENPDAGDSTWDFFDEPDEAAKSEWIDARQLYACCADRLTVRDLLYRCTVGTFRTLAAVVALLERGHLKLTTEAGDTSDAA